MDEKLIKKAIKGNFKAYSLLVHSLKNEGYKGLEKYTKFKRTAIF